MLPKILLFYCQRATTSMIRQESTSHPHSCQRFGLVPSLWSMSYQTENIFLSFMKVLYSETSSYHHIQPMPVSITHPKYDTSPRHRERAAQRQQNPQLQATSYQPHQKDALCHIIVSSCWTRSGVRKGGIETNQPAAIFAAVLGETRQSRKNCFPP